ALTSVKTAVVPPMPSANDSTAADANAGLRRSSLAPNRRSLMNSSINKPFDIVRRQIANGAPRASDETARVSGRFSARARRSAPIPGRWCAKANRDTDFTSLTGTFSMAFASNPLMARGLELAGGNMQVSCGCDVMARILIADDNPDLIDALRLLLKGADIDFDAVTSPEAALRALQSRAFDLVLMDLNYTGDTTSGREGIDLLARVQEIDRLLPVIVMTGWGSVDLAVEAMRRGGRDFLQKPWNNAHL